jgi:hypothetical protein
MTEVWCIPEQVLSYGSPDLGEMLNLDRSKLGMWLDCQICFATLVFYMKMDLVKGPVP